MVIGLCSCACELKHVTVESVASGGLQLPPPVRSSGMLAATGVCSAAGRFLRLLDTVLVNAFLCSFHRLPEASDYRRGGGSLAVIRGLDSGTADSLTRPSRAVSLIK